MTKARDLARKVRSFASLGEIVGAMKALSALHFRETRGAIEPIRTYRSKVERILSVVDRTPPSHDGPVGVLVIGGDFGFCGTYHSLLADAASKERDRDASGPFVVVGHRTARSLERRGLRPTRIYESPTGVDAIASMIVPVVESLYENYLCERISALDVVSSRFGGVGTHAPIVTRLLPIASPLPPDATLTPRYVSSQALATAARRELLYVRLYELIVDALASEHGARLVATESAQSFLDKRSSAIERQIVATRREGTTQEMLEVVAGARARRS